MYKVQKTCN